MSLNFRIGIRIFIVPVEVYEDLLLLFFEEKRK